MINDRSTDLRNEAETPDSLFSTLHREYRFTIDICASARNAKLKRYISKRKNALRMNWGRFGRVWCNCPYKVIPLWLAHALEPKFVMYFLPARTDRSWWFEWKPKAEVHYLVGQAPHARPQMKPPPGIVYKGGNSMSMVLMLFGDGAKPGRERWRSGRTGELLR